MRFLLALLLAAAPAAAQDWPTYNGNLAAQKFAPVTSFTPESVGDLELAWSVETGDVSDGSGDLPETVWSATPIYANETLYLGTPFYRILALDPASGEQRWAYEPDTRLEALTQPALKNRGVAYWEAAEPAEGPCQKRVYIGTMDAHLHAVDADTGALCEDFGEGGILNVDQWNTMRDRWPLSLLQPPTVFNDTLFIGWAGKDWAFQVNPPGNVFAVDARTGALKWQVDFLPEDIAPQTGTTNVWASMSVDEERGILYLPVSSPSPNYWGGNRLDPIPLATSVTAVDTESGEVLWAYQVTHHDIWDYDPPAPPTLVDIERDGQRVPALVQVTKQGFLFVLNRETGEPIFEVEERPVPPSDIPTEVAAPTQPFAIVPPPTNDPANLPPVSRIADIVGFGQCSRDLERYRYEGIYTPPSLEGTLFYPPTAGGAEWGGGAVNPETGIYYLNTSRIVQIIQLIPRDEYEQMDADRGNEQGLSAQEGAPYGINLRNWFNWAGMPCWGPPYGTMSAYDLNTGERLWEVPFGVTQKWGFYMPESWGSPTIGGPVLTAGGVIFIGASMDARVRALDARTGAELWSDQVEAPSVAIPAVYTHEGRDYVVFVAGGNSIIKPQVGDQVVAYALPE